MLLTLSEATGHLLGHRELGRDTQEASLPTGLCRVHLLLMIVLLSGIMRGKGGLRRADVAVDCTVLAFLH